jgi:hypothetical protein
LDEIVASYHTALCIEDFGREAAGDSRKKITSAIWGPQERARERGRTWLERSAACPLWARRTKTFLRPKERDGVRDLTPILSVAARGYRCSDHAARNAPDRAEAARL